MANRLLTNQPAIGTIPTDEDNHDCNSTLRQQTRNPEPLRA